MTLNEYLWSNLWSIQGSVPRCAPMQVFSLAGAAAVVRGGGWSAHQALQRVVLLGQPLHQGPGLLETAAKKFSFLSCPALPSLHLLTALTQG